MVNKLQAISRSYVEELKLIDLYLTRQRMLDAIDVSSEMLTTSVISLKVETLADAIFEICDLCIHNNEPYVYDSFKRVYVRLDSRIKQLVSSLMSKTVSTQYKLNLRQRIFSDEVAQQISSLMICEDDVDEDFESPYIVRRCRELPKEWVVTKDRQAINFKTKEVIDDLEVMKLYDVFYRSKRSLRRIENAKHNDKARIPLLNSILNRILNDWSNDDDSNLKFLKQISYSVITGDNKEKFIVILGGGGNGKSSFIELNESLVGLDHVEHINLHQWSDSNSINKINAATRLISGDDAAKKINASELAISNLKSIVSGNTLSVNRKYSDNILLRTQAMFIQASNHIPAFFENDDSLRSRLIVHQWGHQSFRGKETTISDDHGQQSAFKLKELLKDELFADLYFTMIFDDVEHFTTFDIPESSRLKSLEVLEASDNVGLFMSELQSEVGHLGIIPIQVAYQAFRIWSKDHGSGTIMKLNTFSSELERVMRSKPGQFTIVQTYERFNIKRYPRLNVVNRLLGIEDVSICNNKQRSIMFHDTITESEITEFTNKQHPVDISNSRDRQLAAILMFEMNHSDIISVYGDEF